MPTEIELRRIHARILADHNFGLPALNALLKGGRWSWLPDDTSFMHAVPVWCDDCEIYHAEYHGYGLGVEDGKLYVIDIVVDNIGDWEKEWTLVESKDHFIELQTPPWLEYQQARVDYLEWVIETGNDSADWFSASPTVTVEEPWTAVFVETPRGLEAIEASSPDHLGGQPIATGGDWPKAVRRFFGVELRYDANLCEYWLIVDDIPTVGRLVELLQSHKEASYEYTGADPIAIRVTIPITVVRPNPSYAEEMRELAEQNLVRERAELARMQAEESINVA